MADLYSREDLFTLRHSLGGGDKTLFKTTTFGYWLFYKVVLHIEELLSYGGIHLIKKLMVHCGPLELFLQNELLGTKHSDSV